MKVRSAAIAALAAAAIGAGTLAPAASAWDDCPPGSDNPQYCEDHHHHHHHHHHDGGGHHGDGYYGQWGSSGSASSY